MKTIAWFILLSVAFYSQSQAQSISFPITFDTTEIEQYAYKPVPNALQLRMPYASHRIMNASQAKALKGKTILEIKLIYTDYPKGDDFSLLNKKRLAALFLEAPELFDNPYIQWKLVRQTGATAKTVYNYYHGFEISYRPDASFATAKFQEEYLLNMIKGFTPISDSTVLKVMKRNAWEEMTVVGDFTGSMSPYIGQVLLWYNLAINNKKDEIDAFVFFNDGNHLPTSEKKIGKTGGIYHTTENSIDSVLARAVTTIKNGGGGDGPENDVEALLFAQKEYKESQHYILIADNIAPMRDVELIKKLKKPVRVIVCGASKVVNPQYLKLAYDTKGSLHTIEEDIDELLHEIKEGEVIDIYGRKFKLVGEEFILLQPKKT